VLDRAHFRTINASFLAIKLTFTKVGNRFEVGGQEMEVLEEELQQQISYFENLEG
jgi:hypothetical protein